MENEKFLRNLQKSLPQKIFYNATDLIEYAEDNLVIDGEGWVCVYTNEDVTKLCVRTYRHFAEATIINYDGLAFLDEDWDVYSY